MGPCTLDSSVVCALKTYTSRMALQFRYGQVVSLLRGKLRALMLHNASCHALANIFAPSSASAAIGLGRVAGMSSP